MGGQACVFYGGAEFSRDTDVTILASNENLAHLRSALRELHARRIAIPPFQLDYLTRGHEIHFRSYHPEAMKMRIDVMSVMRGVDQFDQLKDLRKALIHAEAGDESAIESELEREQKAEREADRLYWRPLRSELEELRKSGCAPEEQV